MSPAPGKVIQFYATHICHALNLGILDVPTTSNPVHNFPAPWKVVEFYATCCHHPLRSLFLSLPTFINPRKLIGFYATIALGHKLLPWATTTNPGKVMKLDVSDVHTPKKSSRILCYLQSSSLKLSHSVPTNLHQPKKILELCASNVPQDKY